MLSWKKFKLSDCLTKVERPVEVVLDKHYAQIGIRSHGKGLFHKESVTGEELGNKAVYWVEPDCFVLNIVFAWEQAIGKTTASEAGMIASHRFPMYRPKKELIDIDYLICFFMTKRGKDVLEAASPGGAGRNRTLGQKTFLNSNIVLPPITEQRKIAEILSAQDRIIELKTKLLEEKKRLKKYLCQLIMGGNKIKLARGYSVRLLSSITKKKLIKNKDLKYSVVLSNSAKYGIVPQNVQFDKNIANKENIDRYYVAEIGDFIYNPRISTSAPCGPINQNDCCDGVVSPLYTVFSCSAECVCDKYLKYYFQTSLWHEYIQSVANTGARYDRMNVSDKDFFSMAINLPPLNRQRQCVVLLDAFSNVIKLMEENLEQEKLKKKALMQQLLTGKVRVTV